MSRAMRHQSEELERLALDFVRSAAARALADFKEPAPGMALLGALQGAADPLVIAAILRALKSLRHEPAQQVALALLAHEHTAVRHEAVSLLALLQKPETVSGAPSDGY
jgi:HEAT repeat protein